MPFTGSRGDAAPHGAASESADGDAGGDGAALFARHFEGGLHPVALVVGQGKLPDLHKPMTYYHLAIGAGALQQTTTLAWPAE